MQTKSCSELKWLENAELNVARSGFSCCYSFVYSRAECCRSAFWGLETMAVYCFKCRTERPSHPMVCIQSMTHKWEPWDMGRNTYKANQRILFSLLRGGVGVGVGTREPEGSLVKICSKIVETLLTLVIRLRFFSPPWRHLPIKAREPWADGGRSEPARKFFPSHSKVKPSASFCASPDDITGPE